MMKSISRWARRNPWSGRLIIVAGHVYLIIFGMIAGIASAEAGLKFAAATVAGGIGIFLLATLMFPVKGSAGPGFRYSYRRSRHFHAILLLAGLWITISCANRAENSLLRLEQRASTQEQIQSDNHVRTIQVVHRAQAKKELRAEKRGIRQSVRTHVKSLIREVRETERQGARILLTVLLILGLVVLAGFILAIACNLACSGMGPLATLVAVGGFGIWIWLAIVGVKAIWSRKKRSKVTPENSPLT